MDEMALRQAIETYSGLLVLQSLMHGELSRFEQLVLHAGVAKGAGNAPDSYRLACDSLIHGLGSIADVLSWIEVFSDISPEHPLQDHNGARFLRTEAVVKD
jgi:hypothetical protein